jgi:glycosyltransferase involved in cell wall biosynthesis
MPKSVAIVVPCYNEEARLDHAELLRLAQARQELSLLLVDDGSSDGTAGALERLRAVAPERVAVHRLARNQGKAAAVREGLRLALERGAVVVGYVDADLSTPVDEILRLVRVIEASTAQVVLASRVRLLGRDIQREALRHYLGRVFATLASLTLRLPVYDTQCGAKLFRAGAALGVALEAPFRSRWIFDVELIARLAEGGPRAAPLPPAAFLEEPLRAWRDVGGSKLRARAMIRAGLQLLAMFVRSRLRLRPAPSPGLEPAVDEDASGGAGPGAGIA